MPVFDFHSGNYQGAVWREVPLSVSALADLLRIREWIAASRAIPSLGRHALARHMLAIGNESLDLAIKSFSPASPWRDRYFRKHGSKAERSFRAAVRLSEAGVGTPAPFAFMDRWEQGRLVESYYLCAYQENITSFRDELDRLYAEDPLCRRIMRLMETVGLAIAGMHEAGVCHRDLGNQNILLRRFDDDTWGDVQFIDLNRAHLAERLTLKQRARDISRIDLPSDFLRVFKCMAFRHQHPPEEFQRWERHFRRRFAFHTATRKYRHPIREARQRKLDAQSPRAPSGRELWVWDDRSVQAVSTMVSKERHRYYPLSNHLRVALALIPAVGPVARRYQDELARAFTRPVAMRDKIGMALGPVAGREADEAALLAGLGRGPVLLRFYAHESGALNAQTLAAAKTAKADGRSVFIALVQDRRSVADPERWQRFVERWVPALQGVADWMEIGHAVNRVKWGLWDIRDYRRLVEPVIAAAPGIRLCGPAVIDFEYHFLPAFLRQVPGGALAALSHHLYVDRRGAPENRQGRFAAVEKFALAKALAGVSEAVDGDRVIVSEVNWPILGTGEYSPVNSPYIIPGSHRNDPSVDEDAYANYLVRYYALALCSGLVDQVYWWRLVARGFGLVDDTEAVWRPRPAYHALATMMREVGDATFVERLDAGPGGWALRFERPGRAGVVLAWAHPGVVEMEMPFNIETVIDRDGRSAEGTSGPVQLSGRPVYLVGAAGGDLS